MLVVFAVFVLHNRNPNIICSVKMVRSYMLASKTSECSRYVYINRSYMYVQGIIQ